MQRGNDRAMVDALPLRMRIRVVLPVLFVALAAVPADAGLGGLVRGA